MPKGESVIGVAAGRGWAAAATDRQLVRIFTGSGLQVTKAPCSGIASRNDPQKQIVILTGCRNPFSSFFFSRALFFVPPDARSLHVTSGEAMWCRRNPRG